MTRAHALLISAALLLSACERGAPAKPPGDDQAAAADRALIARIEALPPAQLDIVLFRAIRDAGQDCQGIAASRRIADQAGRPAWSAQCDHNGGRFLLVLSPAGLMNVTPGTAIRQP